MSIITTAWLLVHTSNVLVSGRRYSYVLNLSISRTSPTLEHIKKAQSLLTGWFTRQDRPQVFTDAATKNKVSCRKGCHAPILISLEYVIEICDYVWHAKNQSYRECPRETATRLDELPFKSPKLFVTDRE